MNELTIIGMLIICGVFGFGFIALAIYISFDKSPRTYIRKPPKNLKPKN